MWDLWWTKWHWDRFLPEYIGFPLSVLFHPLLHYLEKLKKKLIIFLSSYHRVAQETLRLRCVRSICCGVLRRKKKRIEQNITVMILNKPAWNVVKPSSGASNTRATSLFYAALAMILL
jgi:hypothetical protein